MCIKKQQSTTSLTIQALALYTYELEKSPGARVSGNREYCTLLIKTDLPVLR